MQGQSSLRTVALAAGALTAVGMATLVATSGTAQAYSNPSFNCEYAKNRTERAICRSWRLARLDRRLAYWYDKAHAAGQLFRSGTLGTWPAAAMAAVAQCLWRQQAMHRAQVSPAHSHTP